MPLGIIDTTANVPGTVLLRDQDGLPGAVGLKHGIGKDANILLVPQPSSDPNDPLNWPRWKKDTVMSILFMSTIVVASVPAPILSSATLVLAKELGKSLNDIAELSGYQLLVAGVIGPFVSGLASKYGKRPQFVFAVIMAVIGTGICIGAHSNYQTLLAGRLIQGFGTTAFESLAVSTIGDLYFVHERPFRSGIMILTLTSVASLAAIIGGPISGHLGWRYLFIIYLPFTIVCALTVIFFVPETQFRRHEAATPAYSTDAAMSASFPEPGTKEGGMSVLDTKDEENHGSDNMTRKGYIQELSLWNGTYTDENIIKLFFAPFLTLLHPIVLWAECVISLITAVYVCVAYIFAQLWSAPPYLLTTAGVGYAFTGGLLGGIIGSIFGAWICKWSTNYLVRLNHGTHEAEFRILPQMIAAFAVGLGWFLWMWDVSHPTPHGYYLGAFCHGTVCFGVSIASVSATLYILDIYRDQSNEIFIALMLSKNLLFYGGSTFVNSWTASAGAADVFKVFGILSLCLIATSIPMYVFGKFLRRVPLLGVSKKARH